MDDCNPFAIFAYTGPDDHLPVVPSRPGDVASIERKKRPAEDAPASSSTKSIPTATYKRSRTADPRARDFVVPKQTSSSSTPLMGAGPRDGPGTFGCDTDQQLLIDRWQSVAEGIKDVATRRFIVMVGVMLSSQCLHGSAARGLSALRHAARSASESTHDLTPAWLSAQDTQEVSDMISMVNFRNTKATNIILAGAEVKKNRGRIPELLSGYTAMRGLGKELGGLLCLVNTVPLAEKYCGNVDVAGSRL